MPSPEGSELRNVVPSTQEFIDAATTPTSTWKRKDKSTDYRLTPELRTRALAELGLRHKDIKVEVFASEANAQEKFYCTEDDSAWQYSWKALSDDSRGYLWANPPFGGLQFVMEKLRKEPVRLCLLVPKWPSQP